MQRILICGMGYAFGGVEEYLMNIFRNIDRDKYIFDFIINDSQRVYCEDEIKKLGGKVFYLNTKNLYYKNKSMKDLLRELRKNHEIIYFNTSSFYNISAYYYSKKLKFKKIIVHAHNTKDTSRSFLLQLIHCINRIYINKIATAKLACSRKAAEWIFGQKEGSKVTIINNAVDIGKFKFNEEKRKEQRKKLNLVDRFVIGHIGRFVYQKNHDFLIDIFNEVVKEKSNAVLLLIGEGELKEKIENKVREYKLEDRVIFYGTTDKVYELYNAMDCFVLPSKYEGLPVCGIEAQANGLYCLFSNTITNELKNSNCVKFIGIDNVDEWKKEILNVNEYNRTISKDICNKYDIKKICKVITGILNK